VKGPETVYKHSAVHAVPYEQLPIVREFLPHWLREGPGYSITRLPLPEALGQEVIGVAPPKPWLLNTGAYLRVAVESGAVLDEYRNNGYDESKLFPVGHPSLDTLSDFWRARGRARKELAENYAFDGSRPICLVSVPPNRHATRQSPEHASYKRLVEAYVSAAKARWQGPVIVSPHPAMTDEERAWVSAAGGILVPQPVAKLMALADLYVCAVSSTIKWALACGLPVLCYEAYRYDANMAALSFVTLAPDFASYTAALEELSDPAKLQDAATRARAHAAHWGQLDGRNMERVVRLCLDRPPHESAREFHKYELADVIATARKCLSLLKKRATRLR
jgi:hypothetical protein